MLALDERRFCARVHSAFARQPLQFKSSPPRRWSTCPFTFHPRFVATSSRMNVLIIGDGGREHALAWKIKQSPRVERVFVAPGNAGTAIDAENVDISPTDFPRLIKFAQQNNVDLTVVGPEAAAVARHRRCVSRCQAARLRPAQSWPPSSKGARSSARTCCATPTCRPADYQVFRNADTASNFLTEREDVPVVVKADGLAAGKGVFVCANRAEAIEAVSASAATKSSATPATRS